jgi:hypothetical protein
LEQGSQNDVVFHSASQRRFAMKALVSSVALAVALAITGPAFAQDVSTAKTSGDCEKAGGMWDEAQKKCVEKKQ